MSARILTTHAGSLPRPAELVALHARRFAGERIDAAELAQRSKEAAESVVRRQIDIGVDQVNNGEVGRESFFTYVQHRMSGFSGQSRRPPMRDIVKYPHFLGYLQRTAFSGDNVSLLQPPQATGPIAYGDTKAIDAECEELSAILRSVGKTNADAFVSSPSPGIIVAAMDNKHYKDLDAYLDAVAAALAVEYRAIIKHGFQLQIDAPDLAMERHTYLRRSAPLCIRQIRGARRRCHQRRIARGAKGTDPPARLLGELRGTSRRRRAAVGNLECAEAH